MIFFLFTHKSYKRSSIILNFNFSRRKINSRRENYDIVVNPKKWILINNQNTICTFRIFYLYNKKQLDTWIQFIIFCVFFTTLLSLLWLIIIISTLYVTKIILFYSPNNIVLILIFLFLLWEKFNYYFS